MKPRDWVFELWSKEKSSTSFSRFFFPWWKKAKKTPRPIHHVTFDGVMAGVLTVRESVRQITVCIFTHPHGQWEIGDLFIFTKRSGQKILCRLLELDTPRDPGDQNFLTLSLEQWCVHDTDQDGNCHLCAPGTCPKLK